MLIDVEVISGFPKEFGTYLVIEKNSTSFSFGQITQFIRDYEPRLVLNGTDYSVKEAENQFLFSKETVDFHIFKSSPSGKTIKTLY